MSNTTTEMGTRRVLRGTVVSTKMQDTITVAIERYVKHPKYKKYQKRTKKYLVHDKGNTAGACAQALLLTHVGELSDDELPHGLLQQAPHFSWGTLEVLSLPFLYLFRIGR